MSTSEAPANETFRVMPLLRYPNDSGSVVVIEQMESPNIIGEPYVDFALSLDLLYSLLVAQKLHQHGRWVVPSSDGEVHYIVYSTMERGPCKGDEHIYFETPVGDTLEPYTSESGSPEHFLKVMLDQFDKENGITQSTYDSMITEAERFLESPPVVEARSPSVPYDFNNEESLPF